MIKKILVGVDFSEHSERIIKYAVQLASKLNAEITLIHSYTLPLVNFETGYIPPIEDIQKEAETEMRALLNKYADYKFNTIIKMGFAAETLLDVAKEQNFDLIIVGIVGSGFVKEKIIGSTAYQLTQQTNTPVLILPNKTEYHPVKKIVFACDFHHNLSQSNLYLKVKDIAQYLECELEIISVIHDEKDVDTKFANNYMFFEKKIDGIPHQHFFITHAKASEGILEYLQIRKSDWIIISPLKHSLFERLFKESITKELVFHSPIPVLTIHE